MGGRTSNYVATTRWGKWLDERLPIGRVMKNQFIDYPTPRNLNYLWTFGGILTLCLVGQIITGVILAMHYQPSDAEAFNSIEHIRRDVNYGWMIRNFHSVGASMFFLAVYIHIFRGFYYGSYKAPREVLWILGVLIMLLMMATAFMGYTLPWGQMSFWGATVITNLFSALDTIYNGLGTAIVQWLWGGYSVSGVTLNRFFSLHYLLPFVLTGVVGLHIWALHVVGQNNPTGLDLKEPTDCVPMHPYATAKDCGRNFRVPDPLRVVRVLRAGLSRRRRQLHRGQSARHATAHRARMVFLAVLRDPQGLHELVPRHPARSVRQALRRRRDVLGGGHHRFRAVARYVARALGEVPADLQMVLLVLPLHVRGARVSRLETSRRRLRVLGADLHRLLLPVLPRGHAHHRTDRDASQAAALDYRGGAEQRPWRRLTFGGRGGS